MNLKQTMFQKICSTILQSHPYWPKAFSQILKKNYYEDLELMLDIGFGLRYPLVLPQAWSSFREIFLEGEYAEAFDRIPLPNRWLDLGCCFGCFSLFIVWLKRKQGVSEDSHALLVDGNSRVEKSVRKLLSTNKLDRQLDFRFGVIDSSNDSVGFDESQLITSGVDRLISKSNKITSQVAHNPVISEKRIMEIMPPPYNLVKLDIEGSEYEFLSNYTNILQQTENLLMEWHDWHRGGGGKAQLEELIRKQGFKLVCELQPLPLGEKRVNGNSYGVQLWENLKFNKTEAFV